MKILVAANQKGGVGKTAALVHVAFSFLERGLKVVLIDLDTQANASYTLSQFSTGPVASEMFSEDPTSPWLREAPPDNGLLLVESDPALVNLERLALRDANARFRASMRQLGDQKFDVCLIDTAPSMGIAMMAALYAADYVFSPIELEAYSIQGIKQLLTTIAHVRKSTSGLEPNTKVKFLGMLPSKVDARKPRQMRNLRELETVYPQLLIPCSIGFRDSIAEALASGVPVWQIKTTAARKATEETRAVADYLYEQMEL